MAGNSTKHLAKQLGLLKRSSSTLPSPLHKNGKRIKKNEQIFDYLVVLDFESTCWKDEEHKYNPEIIEFPAVLVNIATGKIEDKFHYYVQPTEHKKLSPFCIELTGIKQEVVDNGIPIETCLKLFSDWLHKHIYEKQIFFPCISKPSGYHKAILVTWSDWDLNTCLQYECKRKTINYSPYLKSWIDLRKTYRVFYDRKPQGLNGALKDVGIKFQGREHSGIDDAINTSYLASRMVKDGCILKATKSLILSMDVCNRYEILSIMNQIGDSNKTYIDRLGVNDNEQFGTIKQDCILGDIVNKSNQVQNCTDTSSYKANRNKSYSNNIISTINNGTHDATMAYFTSSRVGHDATNTNNKQQITVTPPLCKCGKRCKRKKVVNPGPNNGRVFYSCSVKRFGMENSDACKFFQWESNMEMPPYFVKQSKPEEGVLSTKQLGAVQAVICRSRINKKTELKNQCKSLFNVSSNCS